MFLVDAGGNKTEQGKDPSSLISITIDLNPQQKGQCYGRNSSESHTSGGSIKLTFQIPDFIKPGVFPLSSIQEALLADLGIVELSYADYHFIKLSEIKVIKVIIESYWVTV